LIVAEPGTYGLVCAGGRHAYVARAEGEERLMIDGVEVARHAWIAELAFDGKHHAYLARTKNGDAVVHDGVVVPMANVLSGSLVMRGPRWACVVALVDTRETWIVIDGERRERFDLEELVAKTIAQRRVDRDLVRAWVAAELAK
jgi:hypothetical protein